MHTGIYSLETAAAAGDLSAVKCAVEENANRQKYLKENSDADIPVDDLVKCLRFNLSKNMAIMDARCNGHIEVVRYLLDVYLKDKYRNRYTFEISIYINDYVYTKIHFKHKVKIPRDINYNVVKKVNLLKLISRNSSRIFDDRYVPVVIPMNYKQHVTVIYSNKSRKLHRRYKPRYRIY